MNAAESKQQLGSRTSVKKGGQSIRSRTFAGASKRFLESIARDIIAQARRSAERVFLGDASGGFLDPYNDPRVKEHRRYVDSFDFEVFNTTNRPTIRIFNRATKVFYDGRKYPYADSIEYGTNGPIFPKNGKYLALKVNDSLGDSFLGKKKSQKVNLNSGFTGFINRVDYGRMQGIYLYTDGVPGRKPTGIIASAVDKVLGRRAGQEVRRRQ